MQKKSLLVALFCGALCLTGCIKNEESASVAQVRIAKANELNSIATLNEAKAQAEVIYANAEATIAKAEAALKEAQAALVLAQAETEKVRAELLKTQVALQEVKVEEEKVELQKKLSELEVLLAEAEAAKAKAEAAKQAWVNALNNLLAKAEVDAIKNAQALLKAEEDLEAYVLKLEGQKADSAKYYAGLYFASLKDIEKLQIQELEAKAARVLVNQGAILAREYIYEQIEANNDTIAMNNEIIEALKESQTMTPEEAEEALKEARTNLNAAYTAYREAKEVENAAKDAFDDEWDKTSDFQKFFRNTAAQQGVAMLMPNGGGVRPNNMRADDLVALPLDGAVVIDFPIEGGSFRPTQHARHARGFEWNHKSIVTVDGVDVEVPTAGLNVRTEEGWEFIPFWNKEVTDTVHTRYPDVDVYKKNHTDHLHISDVVIAPATIYYDNIKAALDTAVARAEAQAERNIAREERRMNRQIARIEKKIDLYEDSLALHQAYVDARKDSVAKYEQAYIDALAEAEGTESAVSTAWEAFQSYMMETYPYVSRGLFIARNQADTAFKHAQADSMTYAGPVDVAAKDTNKLKTDVKDAFEAYAKAIGVVERYEDSLVKEGGSAAKEALDAYNASVKAWDYKFANVATEENVDWMNRESEVDEYGYYTKYHFAAYDENHQKIAEAGSSQDSTWTASYNLKLAKRNQYKEQIDAWAGVEGAEARLANETKAVSKWSKKITTAQAGEDVAWLEYVEAYEAFYEVVGCFPDKVYDNYNPNFQVMNWVTFPTDWYINGEYRVYPESLDEDGNWKFLDEEYVGQKPGDSQLTLLNAVKAVVDRRKAYKTAKEAYDTWMQQVYRVKQQGLLNANAALITALGGDPTKDKIEKFMDTKAEGLYQDYLAAVAKLDEVSVSYRKLWMKAYLPYPDEIGVATGTSRPEDQWTWKVNVGWLLSSYHVDYDAKYVGRDGKKHSIAKDFFNNKKDFSLQYKIEEAEEDIEVNLPKGLEWYTKRQNREVKEVKDAAAAAMANVNAYKAYEAGYQNWVEERDAVEEVYIAAQIATYEAKAEYKTAQAVNDAVEAVINEGVYLYDPKMEIYNKFKEAGATHDWRGFTLLPVANAIEVLEDENEELEAENEFLRNVLHDGKNVLSVVNEILDQKIAVISDNIQILVAISAQYRAIMNAYLGIVDEDVTEEPAVEGEEE